MAATLDPDMEKLLHQKMSLQDALMSAESERDAEHRRRLQSDAMVSAREGQVAQLQQTCNELVWEREELYAQLQELEKGEVKGLMDRLKEAQDYCDAMVADRVTMMEKLQKVEESKSQLVTEVANLQAELHNQRDGPAAQLVDAQHALERARADFTAFQEAAAADKAESEREMQSLQNDLQRLKTQLREAEASNTQLSMQLQALQTSHLEEKQWLEAEVSRLNGLINESATAAHVSAAALVQATATATSALAESMVATKPPVHGQDTPNRSTTPASRSVSLSQRFLTSPVYTAAKSKLAAATPHINFEPIVDHSAEVETLRHAVVRAVEGLKGEALPSLPLKELVSTLHDAVQSHSHQLHESRAHAAHVSDRLHEVERDLETVNASFFHSEAQLHDATLAAHAHVHHIQELTHELEASRSETASLKQQLEGVQSEFYVSSQNFQAQMHDMQTALAAANDEKASLSSQLQASDTALQSHVASIQAWAHEHAALQQAYDTLLQQVNDQSALQQLQATHAAALAQVQQEREALKEEVQGLQTTYDGVARQYEAATSDLQALQERFDAQVHAHEAAVHGLEARLNEAITGLQQADLARQDAEGQLAQERSHLQHVQEQLAHAQSVVSELQGQKSDASVLADHLTTLQQTHADLQAQYNEALQQVDALKQQVAAQISSNTTLSSACVEWEIKALGLEEDLATSKAQIARLEEQTASKFNTHLDVAAAAHQRSSAVEESLIIERDLLQKQVTVFQHNIAELERRFASQAAAAEADAKASEKKHKEQLANAREVMQREREVMQKRCEAIKQALTAELTQLKTQFTEAVKHAVGQIDETKQHARLEGRKEAEAEFLSQHHVPTAPAASVAEQVTAGLNQGALVAAVKQAKETARAEHASELMRMEGEFQKEKQTLENTVQQLTAACEAAQSEAASLQHHATALNGSVQASQAEINRLISEGEHLQASLHAYEHHAGGLQHQLEAAHTSIREHEASQSTLLVQLQEITAVNMDLSARSHALQTQLDASVAAQAALQQHIATSFDEAGQHNSRLSFVQTELEVVSRSCAAYNAAIQAVQTELGHLRSTSTHAISSAKEECTQLLHAAREEYSIVASSSLECVRQLQAEKEGLLHQVQEAQAGSIRIAQLEDTIRQQEGLLLNAGNESQQWQAYTQQLQAEHAAALQQLQAEHAAALQQCDLKAEVLQQQVDRLQEAQPTHLHAHNATIQAQDEAIIRYQHRISTLESSVSDCMQEIARHASLSAELQSQVQQHAANHARQVQELQATMAQASTSMQAPITSAIERIRQLQSQCLLLQEQLEDTSSQYAVLKSVHDKLLGEYAALHALVKPVSSPPATPVHVSSKDSRKEEAGVGLTSQLSALSNSVATLRSALLHLRSDVLSMQAEVASPLLHAIPWLQHQHGLLLSSPLHTTHAHVHAHEAAVPQRAELHWLLERLHELRGMLWQHRQATESHLGEVGGDLTRLADMILPQLRQLGVSKQNGHHTIPPSTATSGGASASAESKLQYILDIGHQTGCDTRQLLASASASKAAALADKRAGAPVSASEQDMEVVLAALSEQAALLYLSTNLMSPEQLQRLQAEANELAAKPPSPEPENIATALHFDSINVSAIPQQPDTHAQAHAQHTHEHEHEHARTHVSYGQDVHAGDAPGTHTHEKHPSPRSMHPNHADMHHSHSPGSISRHNNHVGMRQFGAPVHVGDGPTHISGFTQPPLHPHHDSHTTPHHYSGAHTHHEGVVADMPPDPSMSRATSFQTIAMPAMPTGIVVDPLHDGHDNSSTGVHMHVIEEAGEDGVPSIMHGTARQSSSSAIDIADFPVDTEENTVSMPEEEALGRQHVHAAAAEEAPVPVLDHIPTCAEEWATAMATVPYSRDLHAHWIQYYAQALQDPRFGYSASDCEVWSSQQLQWLSQCADSESQPVFEQEVRTYVSWYVPGADPVHQHVEEQAGGEPGTQTAQPMTPADTGAATIVFEGGQEVVPEVVPEVVTDVVPSADVWAADLRTWGASVLATPYSHELYTNALQYLAACYMQYPISLPAEACEAWMASEYNKLQQLEGGEEADLGQLMYTLVSNTVEDIVTRWLAWQASVAPVVTEEVTERPQVATHDHYHHHTTNEGGHEHVMHAHIGHEQAMHEQQPLTARSGGEPGLGPLTARTQGDTTAPQYAASPSYNTHEQPLASAGRRRAGSRRSSLASVGSRGDGDTGLKGIAFNVGPQGRPRRRSSVSLEANQALYPGDIARPRTASIQHDASADLDNTGPMNVNDLVSNEAPTGDPASSRAFQSTPPTRPMMPFVNPTVSSATRSVSAGASSRRARYAPVTLQNLHERGKELIDLAKANDETANQPKSLFTSMFGKKQPELSVQEIAQHQSMGLLKPKDALDVTKGPPGMSSSSASVSRPGTPLNMSTAAGDVSVELAVPPNMQVIEDTRGDQYLLHEHNNLVYSFSVDADQELCLLPYGIFQDNHIRKFTPAEAQNATSFESYLH